MTDQFYEDQVFESVNFTGTPLPKGEYANCRFVQCDFSKADLSFFEFSDCVFDHCNLSLVKMTKTACSDVQFIHCKMLGINFENCSEFLFSVAFNTCVLNFSSFYTRNFQKTAFIGCTLLEADFTEADLSQANFSQADLAGAKFENSNLEKTDFRSALNYSINPEINRIRKAKFSLSGIAGLLDKYDIDIT